MQDGSLHRFFPVSLWNFQEKKLNFYGYVRWLLLVFISFASSLIRHSLITYAMKSKFLTLPPLEYATLHFGTYPLFFTCILKMIHCETRKNYHTSMESRYCLKSTFFFINCSLFNFIMWWFYLIPLCRGFM